MSLINKMLRDLDARHAADTVPPQMGVLRSLPDSSHGSRRALGRIMVTLVCVAGLVFAGWWWSESWQPQVQDLLHSGQAAAGRVPPPAAPISVPGQVPAPALTESLLPLPALGEALMTPQLPGDVLAGLKLDPSLAREPAQPPPPAPAAKGRATTPTHTNSVVIDKLDPLAGDLVEAAYRKGIAAFRQGHLSEAAGIFGVVLRDDPRHLGARQALLGMLAEAKQWDEAQRLLKEGLDILPTHYLWAMALARIQVERGKTADALETLLQHITYAERQAEYQGFTGALLQRLQRSREAAQHLQAATLLKPNEGRWWLGLGIALEADGRQAEAREAFVKANDAGGLTLETQAFVANRLR